MASERTVEERLTALEKRRPSGGSDQGGGQCTADFPHDTLTYNRPNYRCRCGMKYTKDNNGGLVEVAN